MATDTTAEAEAKRTIRLTEATIRSDSARLDAIMRELGRISDLKIELATSGRKDIAKIALAGTKARNDYLAARAGIIKAVASGAYGADVRAAQADVANLRDNYVKMEQHWWQRPAT
jgi:hypothetical protein